MEHIFVIPTGGRDPLKRKRYAWEIPRRNACGKASLGMTAVYFWIDSRAFGMTTRLYKSAISSFRKRQSGLKAVISRSFFSLRHFLISFSLSMACSMKVKCS